MSCSVYDPIEYPWSFPHVEIEHGDKHTFTAYRIEGYSGLWVGSGDVARVYGDDGLSVLAYHSISNAMKRYFPLKKADYNICGAWHA